MEGAGIRCSPCTFHSSWRCPDAATLHYLSNAVSALASLSFLCRGLFCMALHNIQGSKARDTVTYNSRRPARLNPSRQCRFLVASLELFYRYCLHERGMLMRHTNLNESIFHLGIINVLKNVYPPYFPYASGVGFGHYHLNMHLEIEMFSRLFRIDTIRLAYFYSSPSLLLSSCLSSVSFCQKIFGLKISRCSDRSPDLWFRPILYPRSCSGLLPHDGPWNNLFNSTIWPLLTLNGFLPAVIVMSSLHPASQ